MYEVGSDWMGRHRVAWHSALEGPVDGEPQPASQDVGQVSMSPSHLLSVQSRRPRLLFCCCWTCGMSCLHYLVTGPEATDRPVRGYPL